MKLYQLLPTIRAILSNKSFFNNENIDLIDYLIEGQYSFFQADLLVFKFLNQSTPAEREKYITEYYGSYFELRDLGIYAVIGDNVSYVNVAYDWKQNTFYLYHIEIGSLSNAYPLIVLIQWVEDWLHYCDTGFLPEPIVDKNTIEGLEVLIDFYQHHDQTNLVVQEKIAFYTNQKTLLF